MPRNRDLLPMRLRENLFATREEMHDRGLKLREQQRILRQRELYYQIIENPKTSDAEWIRFLKNYGIEKSTAYEDLQAVKAIIGDVQQHSRGWYEWLFLQRIDEAVELAREQGDAKALVSAAAALGKYTRLDHDETRKADYEQIAVQHFEITADYEPLSERKERALIEQAAELIKE